MNWFLTLSWVITLALGNICEARPSFFVTKQGRDLVVSFPNYYFPFASEIADEAREKVLVQSDFFSGLNINLGEWLTSETFFRIENQFIVRFDKMFARNYNVAEEIEIFLEAIETHLEGTNFRGSSTDSGYSRSGSILSGSEDGEEDDSSVIVYASSPAHEQEFKAIEDFKSAPFALLTYRASRFAIVGFGDTRPANIDEAVRIRQEGNDLVMSLQLSKHIVGRDPWSSDPIEIWIEQYDHNPEIKSRLILSIPDAYDENLVSTDSDFVEFLRTYRFVNFFNGLVMGVLSTTLLDAVKKELSHLVFNCLLKLK